MNLKKIGLLLFIVVTIATLVALFLSNNYLVALSVVIVLGILYLFYMTRIAEAPQRPFDYLKESITEACLGNCPENIGYLILTGSNRAQRIVKGKIVGWSEYILTQSTDKKEIQNPWSKLYVFAYRPKVGWLWNTFPLVMFNPVRLFACTEHQLVSKDIVAGDIEILGMSHTTVGIFDMVNMYDLDKDYILQGLHKDVQRITLLEFWNNMAEWQRKAVSSDAMFLKLADLTKPPQIPSLIQK